MINYLYYFIRKLRSAMAKLKFISSTLFCYFNAIGNPAISIESKCLFGQNVSLRATDGGSISLGHGVSLAGGVQIVAEGGRVVVGDGVFVGLGSIVVSRSFIEIGSRTLIAEYVVIRDQDHRTDSIPLGISGFFSNPIRIGSDTWIGCKASILRGASVGDRCVIGAHALVKSKIPDGMIAVGIPARVTGRVRQ